MSKPSRNNKGNIALFPIGVDSGKDTIFSRLQIETAGKYYFHYPIESEKGYDETYFKGLTSEKRVNIVKRGIRKTEWKIISGRRNEPLDLRNYALAALRIANPNLEKRYSTGNMRSKAVIRKRKIYSKGIK